MLLPSGVAGLTTQTVGFFEVSAVRFSEWLAGRLGDGWVARLHPWGSLAECAEELVPVEAADARYGVVPLGEGWSVLLNNTVGGTDVGVLPSRAAEYLGVRGIRAVSAQKSDGELYPATMLSVFHPDSTHLLKYERSIAAANDGGRWVFETSGAPYAFEEVEAYSRRRKSERFTPEMLHRYLLALGVPVDDAPDWGGAYLVERIGG